MANIQQEASDLYSSIYDAITLRHQAHMEKIIYMSVCVCVDGEEIRAGLFLKAICVCVGGGGGLGIEIIILPSVYKPI